MLYLFCWGKRNATKEKGELKMLYLDCRKKTCRVPRNPSYCQEGRYSKREGRHSPLRGQVVMSFAVPVAIPGISPAAAQALRNAFLYS